MLIYEIRFREGQWRVVYNSAVLFSFGTKKEAVDRLDDLAYAGSRIRQDVEIRIYDEQDNLAERYSGLDFEI